MLGKRSRDQEEKNPTHPPEKIAKTAEAIDWSHLRYYGYQVFPGVLTKQECEEAKDGLWQWLYSLDRGLVRNNPDTWKYNAWPKQVHGIIEYPCVSHAPAVWKVRENPKVVNIWASIFKVAPENLISSFDRANIVNERMRLLDKPWWHIDQDSKRPGRQCIQGFVNLHDTSDEKDPNLLVIPKSHLLHNEFFYAFPERTKVNTNWVKFSDDELDWWRNEAMGEDFKPTRVLAKAGDVVVWDSRLIHCGGAPAKGHKAERYVIYTCYEPRALATPEQICRKQEVFLKGQGTSHWPRFSKVFPRPQWSQNQKDPPYTVLRTRLQDLTPLGKHLAGF